MIRSTWSTKAITLLSILSLVILWQIGSKVVQAYVILPPPLQVLSVFFELIGRQNFSIHVIATIGRVFRSFIIIVISGIVVGMISGYVPLFGAYISPFVTICKATPVMAVILLAFIWFSSGTVPIFSAFLMGFPVMFIQVERGVGIVSYQLQEMARCYQFRKRDRLFHIIIPSILPSIITGSKTSLSMVWKVVIASEVLTVPRYGVGSRMQMAQVNLLTSEVLAWTIVAILLTAIGDLLFNVLLRIPHWRIPKKQLKAQRV